jgi:hypothetical protein
MIIERTATGTAAATPIEMVGDFALEIFGDAKDLDPRHVFLLRASARLALIEAGEMDVHEAFSDLVCDLDFEDRVELLAQQANRAERRRAKPDVRPTTQTTIEAILYCVRERGVAALKEPANRERLQRCDAAARQQINGRIDRLQKGDAS